MAVQKDCSACSKLRANSDDFVVNGVTKNVCTNLKNNRGFGGSSTDCTDLDRANDCLIGNMEDHLEAYEVCDWKAFMHKFIHNLWNVLKAIICAICGIWTNIDKIWCWLDNIVTPKNYTLHAYVDDDPSKEPLNHFRIASGLTVRYNPDNPESSAPMRIYIKNNLARITGSLTCDGNMPSSYNTKKTTKWLDFFDGSEEIETSSGGQSWKGNCPGSGLFMYEYQIKPCDYGFKTMWACNMFAGYAGDFMCKAVMYKPGDKYPGDNGEDDAKTYNPSDTDLRLIQVRLVNMRTWGTTRNHGRITPNGITGVDPCTESFDC